MINSDPIRRRWVSFIRRSKPGIAVRPRALSSCAARLSRGSQSIAEPAYGLDQIAGGAELRPQPLHVHVDRSRLDVRRRFPYGLEQMASCLHAAAPFGERDEQA